MAHDWRGRGVFRAARSPPPEHAGLHACCTTRPRGDHQRDCRNDRDPAASTTLLLLSTRSTRCAPNLRCCSAWKRQSSRRASALSVERVVVSGPRHARASDGPAATGHGPPSTIRLGAVVICEHEPKSRLGQHVAEDGDDLGGEALECPRGSPRMSDRVPTRARSGWASTKSNRSSPGTSGECSPTSSTTPASVSSGVSQVSSGDPISSRTLRWSIPLRISTSSRRTMPGKWPSSRTRWRSKSSRTTHIFPSFALGRERTRLSPGGRHCPCITLAISSRRTVPGDIPPSRRWQCPEDADHEGRRRSRQTPMPAADLSLHRCREPTCDPRRWGARCHRMAANAVDVGDPSIKSRRALIDVKAVPAARSATTCPSTTRRDRRCSTASCAGTSRRPSGSVTAIYVEARPKPAYEAGLALRLH